MLTDEKMLKIAERYLKKLKELGDGIEVIIERVSKKLYGNIYPYESKEYIETGNFNKSLFINFPFLVEKKAGRVVQFSNGYANKKWSLS